MNLISLIKIKWNSNWPEVDRSWVDDLTVISRALYNYPEIEVYKLAIDYKKDSKKFAERERILNFYLEDGK